MKFSIILSFFLFTTINLIGQGVESGSLWQVEMVYDTLGNKLPNEKIERFMYIKNDSEVSMLTIYEKLNMTNGEIIVSYMIEADNLEKQTESEYKIKELHVDEFKLINSDSIFYKKFKYCLGFKRIDVSLSSVTQAQLMEFLFSSSVRNYYDNGESLNQVHTYKNTGQKGIQIVDSNSNWESDYRVFNFEGFLFLKGITSPPMLIEKIDNERVIGKEADYRFDTKNFEIRRERI